jgi:hypothetical protein
MNCLALDIATTTGWAFARIGDAPVFGAMTFAGELGEFIFRPAKLRRPSRLSDSRPERKEKANGQT